MEMLSVILRHDPAIYTKGWIVTVAGFLIVIIALFILSMIFRGVASYFKKKDEGKETKVEKLKAKGENLSPVTSHLSPSKDGISNEVLTAIGMALYLSTNLHDEESNVITIERRQTSWNDKNYGVRHWKR